MTLFALLLTLIAHPLLAALVEDRCAASLAALQTIEQQWVLLYEKRGERNGASSKDKFSETPVRDYVRAYNEYASVTGGYIVQPAHPKNSSWHASPSPSGGIQSRKLVFRDGLIYRADGTLFDTKEGQSVIYPSGNYVILRNKTGCAIVVMDIQGNFYFELKQEPGRVHHTTIIPPMEAITPVPPLKCMPMVKLAAGAGTMVVHQGQLLQLTDESGHVLPPRILTQQMLRSLETQGVDMGAVEIKYTAPERYSPAAGQWYQDWGVPVLVEGDE